MTITNEAVEVAARALMLNDPVYRKAEWDYAAKSLRSMFLSDARAALEAAEPFITAELRAEIRDRLNAMKAMRQRVEVNLHLCFAKRSRYTASRAALGAFRAIRADGYLERGRCWRKSMGK